MHVVAYTDSMSVFVKSTMAPKPKTQSTRAVSLALAAVFIVMATAQLFSFENFPEVIRHMWLPLGEFAPVRAALLVTIEVLALPFLLSMSLSRAMRVFSMVAGWLAIGVWLMISLWVNLSGDIVTNSGLLGATVSLPVGWWNILFCLALGVLAAWSAWGMWPLTRSEHSK
jgi:hypothetical protein